MNQEKIQQLQIIEQNLNNILIQKQQFQNQLFGVENALKELNNSQNFFKIVGNIMIEKSKKDLEKDLQEQKEISELRVQALEKQEKELQERARKIQEEVLNELKKNESKNSGTSN